MSKTKLNGVSLHKHLRKKLGLLKVYITMLIQKYLATFSCRNYVTFGFFLHFMQCFGYRLFNCLLFS